MLAMKYLVLFIISMEILCLTMVVDSKITMKTEDTSNPSKETSSGKSIIKPLKEKDQTPNKKAKTENKADDKKPKERNEEKQDAFSLDKYFSSLKSSDYIFGRCDLHPDRVLPKEEQTVHGSVSLRQKLQGGVTQMVFNVSGFNAKQSKYAVHVHNFGDMSVGCSSTGDHYNPFGTLHGGPKDHPALRHFGDLGNLETDKQGNVVMKMEDPLISLLGPFSALGRAIVIHSKGDDLGTKKTEESLLYGSSGKPLACCVIGLSDTQQWQGETVIEESPIPATPVPRVATTKPQKKQRKRKKTKQGRRRTLRKKTNTNKKKMASTEKAEKQDA